MFSKLKSVACANSFDFCIATNINKVIKCITLSSLQYLMAFGFVNVALGLSLVSGPQTGMCSPAEALAY